ncbi:response regulator transcription factor [Leucobacter sp. CSA1]|uniref:Response regulator transcription factor n=1 Tax=Leucobacter chromiisoli TaxID=2796471 RepID=A0A934UUD6_9MICO|nr:response regulator transcription factor [Leucobacter chromiisoli]MBK0418311.1 response regulator transcription factor [Leucobacter chromiisoli]
MTLSVLLVDDHPIVRAGLRTVLDSAVGARVVGEAATGEEAIEAADVLRPDVVLCDLRLGDGIDGIETTARLRELRSAPAVLILTTSDRDVDVLRAIEAGAAGYLLKDAPTGTILAGIADAAAGRTVIAPELRVRAERAAPAARLTERELEVLALLAEGRSNREIARRLFVSESTVKTHVVHLLAKLGADSRGRAAAVARERGLLE